MPQYQLENQLKHILSQYRDSFAGKTYEEGNNDPDPLMDVFGITPELKREHPQYWGRELGMCWQRLVCDIFQITCSDYQPAWQVGDDEPYDCRIAKDAIDTKYRIGSGDSGTQKKFKEYGKMLTEQGLRPVLLIVREDNLDTAISACKAGGWHILTGDHTFQYIYDHSRIDLKGWLHAIKLTDEFRVNR